MLVIIVSLPTNDKLLTWHVRPYLTKVSCLIRRHVWILTVDFFAKSTGCFWLYILFLTLIRYVSMQFCWTWALYGQLQCKNVFIYSTITGIFPSSIVWLLLSILYMFLTYSHWTNIWFLVTDSKGGKAFIDTLLPRLNPKNMNGGHSMPFVLEVGYPLNFCFRIFALVVKFGVSFLNQSPSLFSNNFYFMSNFVLLICKAILNSSLCSINQRDAKRYIYS